MAIVVIFKSNSILLEPYQYLKIAQRTFRQVLSLPGKNTLSTPFKNMTSNPMLFYHYSQGGKRDGKTKIG